MEKIIALVNDLYSQVTSLKDQVNSLLCATPALPDNSNWVPTNESGKLIQGSYHSTQSTLEKLNVLEVDIIVSLIENKELKKKSVADSIKNDPPTHSLKNKFEYYYLPIPDNGVGNDDQVLNLVDTLYTYLKNGKTVFVSCLDGGGRSSSIIGALLGKIEIENGGKANYYDILNQLQSTRNKKSKDLSSQQFMQLQRLLNGVSEEILFYKENEKLYGVFSNFYDAPINSNYETWSTVEAYFQGQKFNCDANIESDEHTEYMKLIRQTDSPWKARMLGEQKLIGKFAYKLTISKDNNVLIKDIIKKYSHLNIRDDWEDIKMDVMKEGLLQKFTQHHNLKDVLLSTNNSNIVEHYPYSAKTGWGQWKGEGENNLGKLLMELREELRK